MKELFESLKDAGLLIDHVSTIFENVGNEFPRNSESFNCMFTLKAKTEILLFHINRTIQDLEGSQCKDCAI